MTARAILCRRIVTPIGVLHLAADDDGLRAIEFPNNKHPTLDPAWPEGRTPILDPAEAELREYLAGTRRSFTVPLAPHGTPFQVEVWRTLAGIPYGATIHYGELAARVGRPAASRAVGAANGRNPLPLVLPCHRVIGKDGSLTGFGGGPFDGCVTR